MTDLEILARHPELLATPVSDSCHQPDHIPLGWVSVEDARALERRLNMALHRLHRAEREAKMYRNMVGPRERDMVREEMGGLAA